MTDRRFLLFNTVLSLAIGAAVSVGVRLAALGTATPPESAEATTIRPKPPILLVARVLRASKLITVEISTSVTSESVDRSWRGDAQAQVVVPVRLYYGVDLSSLSDGSVMRDPLSGGWRVRLPAPRRLAIEVVNSDETTSVQVSGTRLRDVAGEYHLGQARVKLYDRAHAMVLTHQQSELVERLTREQVENLVRTIIGESAAIEVDFEKTEQAAAGDDAPRVAPGAP